MIEKRAFEAGVVLLPPAELHALGQLVVAMGGYFEPASLPQTPEAESLQPLNRVDFAAVAAENGHQDYIGTRAFNALARLFHDKYRADTLHIKDLPTPRFGIFPDEAAEPKVYWQFTEKVFDLDPQSFRDFVGAIDERLGKLSASGQRQFIRDMGRNIGPGTLEIWRLVVKNYFPDYGQVDTSTE